MICRSKNPIGLDSKRHCRRLGLNRFCAKSRRVKKVTPNATTVFFYDDWNLIEERIEYENGTTTTIKYYWGKELSGSLQGAEIKPLFANTFSLGAQARRLPDILVAAAPARTGRHIPAHSRRGSATSRQGRRC